MIWTGNAELLVAWTRRAAEAGARIVVFPEMILTGYPVEDLALRASFVEASVAATSAVAARLDAEGLGGIAVLTGYLDRRAGARDRVGRPTGSPLDAAALLHGGRVVVTSAKHHLPNYGVFDEYRYFVPGDVVPVFRLAAGDGGGGAASRWTSPWRSARTCGRTAGRWRSPARPGRACWWCPTRRRTSGARTTRGSSCASAGPGRPARRWPT